MKKFIYISGIVLINIIALGAILKTLHLPGAGVMLVFGQVFFALCFLPLAIINSYKGNGRNNKPLYIAGFICAFFVIIGSLFKIQHYQGANILMMIGVSIPFLYFLPVYIFHHNKSKEKSSMNFLGVMFLMVFIALFTSLLAVNVSSNIIEAMKKATNDFSKTTEIYSFKNDATYKTLEKYDDVGFISKLTELKKRTNAVSDMIENLKMELVKRITGNDTFAIKNNKIILDKIEPPTETNVTSFIICGSDNTNGKATEIKNVVADYRIFLNTILAGNKENLPIINSLLTTADKTIIIADKSQTETWENSFFSRNTCIINVLGNLNCIKTNVKMAEAEALSCLTENKMK